MPIEAIIFDLGGVLVDWAGVDAIIDLAAKHLDRETARRFWMESPWIRRFETGRCSPEDFAAGVVRDLELKVTPDAFLAEFRGWVRGPYPGALELLEALRPRYTLACLSNTNALHGALLRDDFGFGERLDGAYFSFQIGHMKPDREAFEHVLRGLGRRPESTVFLDDNIECVEGAARVGLIARHVRGIEGVRAALADLGIEH
jgi:putative hydrolase of the HAD superfamily